MSQLGLPPMAENEIVTSTPATGETSRMRADRALRRRVLAGGLTVGLVALAVPAVVSAANACAMPKDLAALNARVLQTELMVAALTCGEKARYNAFVMSFKGVLGKHGRELRGLFDRVHGAAGSRELNGFVTKLANDASQESLAASQGYCTGASALFEEVLNTPPSNFDAMAAKPWISGRHGYSPCTVSADKSGSRGTAGSLPVKAN
jgi:hypothetical protein